jgi:hypothetical protein
MARSSSFAERAKRNKNSDANSIDEKPAICSLVEHHLAQSIAVFGTLFLLYTVLEEMALCCVHVSQLTDCYIL